MLLVAIIRILISPPILTVLLKMVFALLIISLQTRFVRPTGYPYLQEDMSRTMGFIRMVLLQGKPLPILLSILKEKVTRPHPSVRFISNPIHVISLKTAGNHSNTGTIKKQSWNYLIMDLKLLSLR